MLNRPASPPIAPTARLAPNCCHIDAFASIATKSNSARLHRRIARLGQRPCPPGTVAITSTLSASSAATLQDLTYKAIASPSKSATKTNSH